MTHVDEIIERAKDGLPESEVAILARELLKTREQLALAQRAKGDAEGLAALSDRRAALRNKKLVVVSTPPTKPPYEELIRKYEGVTFSLASRPKVFVLSSPSLAKALAKARVSPLVPAESDDHVARFHDCPGNEVCTPDGCKAGAGNWPRCPKTSTEPTL